MDNHVTVVGNLTDDPELKYTAQGAAVVNFRIAVNRRIRDAATNEWKDGDASYFRVNCWRDLAEHCAESLRKGTRVIVTGTLRWREWQTQEGDKRSVVEIEGAEIGPSLRWATADVKRATRGSAPARSGGSDWNADVPVPEEVPF